MRIEIDKDLAQLLDQIKNAESSIYGRGHVETVRFLANYYLTHKPLGELETDIKKQIRDFFGNLDTNLETALARVILKARARAAVAVLKLADELEKQPATDEKQPVERSRGAEKPAPGGR